MEIAFASTNINKCYEIKSVASQFNITVLSIREIQSRYNLSPLPDIAETGSTYLENSFIKAKACIEWCGLPSIGDDSGLEVEILGGAPGIYSARYAGKGASDLEKIKKLLSDVQHAESTGLSNRNARFRAVLCFIPDVSSEGIYFEGTLDGFIIDTPRGENGFGYDPVVDIPEIGGTLAEFDSELVCSRGFRAKAAKQLFSFIVNME
jgi:XTP/dITP diphosphohydrolase